MFEGLAEPQGCIPWFHIGFKKFIKMSFIFQVNICLDVTIEVIIVESRGYLK